MRDWVYAMTLGLALVGCDAKSLVTDALDAEDESSEEEDEEAAPWDPNADGGDDTDTAAPGPDDPDGGEPVDTGESASPDDGDEGGTSGGDDGILDDTGLTDGGSGASSGGSSSGSGSDGGGSVHGLPPTAICSVTPASVLASLETADWIGSESYDPFGYTLTYEWRLIVVPEGSTATMPEGDADRFSFLPDLAGDYVGQLVVTNSLGLASEPCEVRLNATPTERPTATCNVEPNPIRPLLDSADWIGSESSDPSGLPLTYDWTLVEVPSGSTATMPAGDADRLDFVPDLEGNYVGQLIVTNSAGVPSTPCTTTLEVIPNRPVAVCDVTPSPVRPIIDSADWIGSGSYDPDGLTLSYDWTLIDAPEGSGATMPFGGADRLGFIPDLAGEYTGRLVVTNSGGVASAPCITTLEAIPSENLWVEMFWTYSGDDMDLHLLAPGATSMDLTSDRDCYYGNCTYSGLDWGVPGDTSDDPFLDLDDISGTGPENINIESPEDGVYTVLVHDYPGSVYSGGNPVTVNIYLDGALAWTDTRSITVENSYTEFAAINTITGTVTGL